ncbi:MAG: nitroreductase [Pseudomonadota bacterium]
MNVSEAVKTRRTIRGFKPEPVPEATIREIIDIARHAPSNSNTQPWHIAVVSGDARRKLEAAIFAEMQAGMKPYPEWPAGGTGLKGVYKQRQIDCAFEYYDAVGIDRDDRKARAKLVTKNWNFFGAPHAAFFSMPDTMHRANAVDIGIILQTIMLLMVERGIASCPQGALAAYPGPVKEIAGIPEGNGIICGLSFGYADEEAPANQARMPREPFDVVARLTSD